MNIAVIFAGGVGSRMHSKQKPKQFLEMYNKPIIIHIIMRAEQSRAEQSRAEQSRAEQSRAEQAIIMD